MQRVKLGMDNDQIMIDNRSQRWRAESHAPAHDASPKIAGQARMGRTVSIRLYEDAVGQPGEK